MKGQYLLFFDPDTAREQRSFQSEVLALSFEGTKSSRSQNSWLSEKSIHLRLGSLPLPPSPLFSRIFTSVWPFTLYDSLNLHRRHLKPEKRSTSFFTATRCRLFSEWPIICHLEGSTTATIHSSSLSLPFYDYKYNPLLFSLETRTSTSTKTSVQPSATQSALAITTSQCL